jgi:hypothetical protein
VSIDLKPYIVFSVQKLINPIPLENKILDGDELFEHQKALKLVRVNYLYFFLFIIGMLLISILKPFNIDFNLVLWSFLGIISFLEMLYKLNKYSYVYFYTWKESVVTLYLTKVLGKTKQVSFSKHSIRHAKVLKFLSSRKGTLILNTYSKDHKFTLLGTRMMSELPSTLEQN